MKSFLLKISFGLAIAALSISAIAQTSTHEYLELREKTINVMHAQYADQENARLSLAANRGLHNLQISLQKLVGRVNIKGFPNSGKGVLGSRDDDQYEGLDGIVITSFDGKTQLFVTTVPIMQAWLAVHKKDVSRYPDLAELVGTENFYNATSTISGNAAVYAYGEIPVTANSGLIARAIIFALGQDDPAPKPPKNLAVSVMSGDRIYVFTEAIVAPDIPECKSLSQQTSMSFEQCFARKMSSQPEYSHLIGQAQTLVDHVSQSQQH
ncbi:MULTISPECIES: hypothetical protein [unclassified Caballeronia]|uniref:hypothetical protein n=1 Tax=unclassified Caballeronia TaxID=2646786 RepID=UPI002857C1A8|nr:MULTISPECIES: hypothetical protein [unclassified Caballeronia]MDR5752221.1 hypothetical protein [Caballeronia sp. LZ024]MDR5841932.1 hypothetical protein [Caballeronia sp. LZ031]